MSSWPLPFYSEWQNKETVTNAVIVIVTIIVINVLICIDLCQNGTLRFKYLHS